MDEQIAAARADPATSLIILDAAILLETGWGKRCDRIVYVHAPRRQRLERVLRQRGWDEKEVIRRGKAQWQLTDKVSRADAVINNSGTVADLGPRVDCLIADANFFSCCPKISTP